MRIEALEAERPIRGESDLDLSAELVLRTAACERLLGEQRDFLICGDRAAALPRAILLEALTLEALDRRQTVADLLGAAMRRIFC